MSTQMCTINKLFIRENNQPVNWSGFLLKASIIMFDRDPTVFLIVSSIPHKLINLHSRIYFKTTLKHNAT